MSLSTFELLEKFSAKFGTNTMPLEITEYLSI
jgi:hypothetical protein